MRDKKTLQPLPEKQLELIFQDVGERGAARAVDSKKKGGKAVDDLDSLVLVLEQHRECQSAQGTEELQHLEYNYFELLQIEHAPDFFQVEPVKGKFKAVSVLQTNTTDEYLAVGLTNGEIYVLDLLAAENV